MLILHIIPSYFPATYWGGPVHSMYELNNAITTNPGIKLTVATTDSAGPKLKDKIRIDDYSIFPNYKVYYFRRVAGRSISLSLIFSLPKLIHETDIIHLSAAYSFPILPSFLLCRVFRKPLVWSPCGAILDTYTLSFSPKKKIKAVWEKIINLLISPKKMVLHTTSIREKEVTEKYITRARPVVIPHGIDIPTFSARNQDRKKELLHLLFLSRLDPKKGLENLFAALCLLNDSSITLEVCGDGDPAYVRSLIREKNSCGLPDSRVHFAGEVTGERKEAAFRNADVFILPSYSESFGIAIAEALSHGLPVIASRNTPWEGVETNRCGLWIENDPASIAAAIMRIREMDLAEMGINGREWMQRDYSWEAVAQSMLEVYQSLVMENND
jgi:glycosyltransferase involved in cell wall biosynthesis